VFFFFSNRLGCLGSLLLSAAVTIALLLFSVCCGFKAARATDGRAKGYPLVFTTEPEE
jgi:hypothetical protein